MTRQRKRSRRNFGRAPVTPREVEHILYLIRRGEKVADILRISGRCYATVRKIADRNGLSLGVMANAPSRTSPTDAQKVEIVELGAKGIGSARIARLLGLTEKTVHNHLQKEGIFVGRGGFLTAAIEPAPGFPESDDFDLEPAERARLEYVRKLKQAKWEHLHPKRKENDNDPD